MCKEGLWNNYTTTESCGNIHVVFSGVQLSGVVLRVARVSVRKKSWSARPYFYVFFVFYVFYVVVSGGWISACSM